MECSYIWVRVFGHYEIWYQRAKYSNLKSVFTVILLFHVCKVSKLKKMAKCYGKNIFSPREWSGRKKFTFFICLVFLLKKVCMWLNKYVILCYEKAGFLFEVCKYHIFSAIKSRCISDWIES